MKNWSLVIILFLFFEHSVFCQNNAFSGQIIIESNFSQIRGDELAGYHKINLGGGIGVSYRIHQRWNLNLSLLYRKLGSRNSIFQPKQVEIIHNYALVPITLSYLTWWDNGLPKFEFNFGVIPGRLLNSEIKYQKFIPYADQIKKNDVSLMGGFGLWFNRHHGCYFAYQRSITPFINYPAENILLKLYYLTLQYQYRF